MRRPVSSAKDSNTRTGRGEPPLDSMRTVDIASRSPGVAHHAWYIAGAPAIVVTRQRVISWRLSTGSKRSLSTQVAPAATASPRAVLSPYTWNIGSTTSTTSSSATAGGSVRASSISMLARSAPCVSIAPLGRPLVPAVNSSSASASGEVATSARTAPSPDLAIAAHSAPAVLTTSQPGSAADDSSPTCSVLGCTMSMRAPESASSTATSALV